MGAKEKLMTAEGDWKEVILLKSGTVIGYISSVAHVFANVLLHFSCAGHACIMYCSHFPMKLLSPNALFSQHSS
jgi:hypothetical protein